MFALFIVIMAVRIMPDEGAKSLGLPISGLLGSMLVIVAALVLAIGVRIALNR
jgi:hypothetical protein